MEAILLLLAGLASSNFLFNSGLGNQIPSLKAKVQFSGLDSFGMAMWLRRKAAESLGNMNSDARPATEQLLLTLREDKDPDVESEAAWALCGMGPPVHSSLDQLVKSAQDADVRVRRWVISAMSKDTRALQTRGGVPSMMFGLIGGQLNLWQEMNASVMAKLQAWQSRSSADQVR